jgi:hypothetical protein
MRNMLNECIEEMRRKVMDFPLWKKGLPIFYQSLRMVKR